MHSDNLFGRRILEERERLGLSQQEAANAAGVRREMWAKYEAGAEPKAKVLAGMAAAGADVQYILTGKRQGQGIGEAAVHQAVLDAVDLLSLEKKVDAGQLAKAVVKLVVKTVPAATVAASGSGIHVSGGNNRIAGNNYQEVTVKK